MKIELINKIYSTSSFYFARVISCLIYQLIYPLILSFICFWFLGITIVIRTFVLFLLMTIGVCFCGCSLGFILASLLETESRARAEAELVFYYLILLGGGWSNLTRLDPFNSFMSYLSPCRYAVETYFRLISSE
jgi:hypothetical protein